MTGRPPDPTLPGRDELRREIELLEMVEQRRALVVVADGQKSMRHTLARTLRAAGFSQVRRVADGRAALEVMEKEGCQLALVDWNLPRRDGLQVLERVRAHPELAPMVFILVSAETLDTRVMQAAEEAHDAYLSKPIRPETLIRRLELILHRRGTRARARLLEASGRVERAMEEYLRAAHNHPGASWPLLHLGRLLCRRQRLVEARDCYRRVLERDPGASWALLELGRLEEARGRAGSARRLYRRALADNPAFFRAYDALARSFLQEGHPARARQVLEEALAQGGGLNAARQSLLGRLLFQQGEWAGAADAFGRALDLKPYFQAAENHLYRAQALMALGRPQEALAQLEASARAAREQGDVPTLTRARLLAGVARAQAGDRAGAEDSFRELARPASWPGGQPPFSPPERERRVAQACLQAGEDELGRRHLGAALELAPKDRQNLAALDELCQRFGLEGGVEGLRHWLAGRREQMIEEYSRRGLELVAQGLWDQALEQYRRGLELDPGSGRLCYNQARVYLRKQEMEQAISLMVRAARLGLARRDWELVLEVANFLAGRGMESKARALLEQVLTRDPDNPQAHWLRGRLEQ